MSAAGVVLTPLLLAESPKWLGTKGRNGEAKESMNKFRTAESIIDEAEFLPEVYVRLPTTKTVTRSHTITVASSTLITSTLWLP
eukprot:SAG31_NODE_9093_length_1336_cov_1.227162_1_plen_84_part_00